MAAQPIPDVLTLDEYLRTSYEPDMEFVDGHIEEKNMGTKKHSRLQRELVLWFGNRRKLWSVSVMPEVRTRTSRTRVRLPDVCVVALADDDDLDIQMTPPLIVIEVLSPEDRLVRVERRLDDFLRMGVEHIWLLDPVERAVFTYTANGLKRFEAERLTLPDSPIYLDLAEVFAALD